MNPTTNETPGTYLGHVKNGVIVLDVPTSLSEGQAVRVVPVPHQTNDHVDEPWTDEKNNRRCSLIDKKYNGEPLTLDEEVELLNLQEEVGRHVRRVAPLPLEAARKLHQELLLQASQNP